MQPASVIHALSADDLARCVHCGFCLQACPTYLALGMETESPRGRIRLARALAEGEIQPTANVALHFDLCLQCRACETACPSGVPYGRIIEGARAMVMASEERPRSWWLRRLVLRTLFARPWILRTLFAGLRLYQRSPVPPIIRRYLPPRLRDMESMLPTLSERFFDGRGVVASPPAPRTTVAMLTGCVMPMTNPRAHGATARVLARNGVRVVAPPEQVCCGALHVHNGDPQAARALARRNIEVFAATGADYYVVNAAGCGSAMKEYGELLAHDRRYAERARQFASKVRDITELLVDLPFERPAGAVRARVTYQDSCHLAHAQRIREAPRQILASIAGLEVVEMETPDRCCGSAGIYNLTQADMSRRVLEEKMQDVASTGAEVIATANPGCMLQLEAGVRRAGGRQEVVHVVELLDRAYETES